MQFQVRTDYRMQSNHNTVPVEAEKETEKEKLQQERLVQMSVEDKREVEMERSYLVTLFHISWLVLQELKCFRGQE